MEEDSGQVIPPAEHRPSQKSKHKPSASSMPVEVIEEEDEEEAVRKSGQHSAGIPDNPYAQAMEMDAQEMQETPRFTEDA